MRVTAAAGASATVVRVAIDRPRRFPPSQARRPGTRGMLQRLREFTRKLRAGADAALRSEQLLRRIHQTQVMAELSQTARFKDPLRLLASGYRVFSQNQEDGMIAEVFRRIGATSRRFVEVGVEDGLECNSAFLLTQGWRGAWIEGSSDNAARARAAVAGHPGEV